MPVVLAGGRMLKGPPALAGVTLNQEEQDGRYLDKSTHNLTPAPDDAV